ncbi:MAG: hypothetical protein RIC55_11560 [Pirellulaceae bacterium]
MYRTLVATCAAATCLILAACDAPRISEEFDDDSHFAGERSELPHPEAATPTRLAGEQRDQYVREMRIKIMGRSEVIEAVSAQVETYDQQARQAWAPKLAELRDKRDELRRMLEEVSEAEAQRWVDLKPGVADAWVDFERAVGEAARDVTVDRPSEESDESPTTSDDAPTPNSNTP